MGCLASTAVTQVAQAWNESETEAEYEGDAVTFDIGDIVKM